jgi:hypothetical protein
MDINKPLIPGLLDSRLGYKNLLDLDHFLGWVRQVATPCRMFISCLSPSQALITNSNPRHHNVALY